MPLFGRSHQSLVHPIDVFYLPDPSVQIQCGLLLVPVLVFDGQVRVRCTGDFLVRNVHLLRSP